jgi:outer membrane protein OmpA-like peptidoglycan-associated protein
MMRTFISATLATGLLVLVACETAAGPEGELSRARAAVTRAEADPGIAKYASTELDRARRLLASAEDTAQEKHGHEATATHYAYLATQMARIAEQRAREQAALVRVQSGEAERRQLLEQAPTGDSRATLDEDKVVQTDRGLMLTLDDGTFDKNRAVIKPAARRGLDTLAKFLHDNPGRRVQIEAFTDTEGSSVYNLELSQDRADAVALAVIDRGVDAARVRAVGWGERFPVADNDDEAARQRNRRVEIIVSKGDAAVPVRVVNAP